MNPPFLLLLCFLARLVAGQVPSMGRCPTKLSAVVDLNVEQFLGRWYEAEKYPVLLEAGGKCTTTTFDVLDEHTLRMTNTQINRFTNNAGGFTGRIALSEVGQLTLSLPVQPFSAVTFDTPYWILDTDYAHYAVIYACRDMAGLMSGQMVWILTRAPRPSGAIMDRAFGALDRNRVSKSYLTHTDQATCAHSAN